MKLLSELPSASNSAMRFYATMWSLRRYPTARREWTWERKFEQIRRAGFTGIMSPAVPAIAERGGLEFLAITSIDKEDQIARNLDAACSLGALGMIVQLADFDTPLERVLELVKAIMEAGCARGLPVEVETHRNTYLETSEKTQALESAWLAATGAPLPLCFDFSHFAVVRHMKAPFWPEFAGHREAIARARYLHLRPFNGHHCQIPVTGRKGKRAPEYRDWLEFVRELFMFLASSPPLDRIVVPELGHDAPAYRLACFPDTWTDTCVAHDDLRRLWRQCQRAAEVGV